MKHEPLIIERILDAPAAKVWKLLTDIKELKRWNHIVFGNVPEFKPEPGFAFHFSLGPDTDNQFLHLCEVTDVVEGKKLAYSWRYDGYEGSSILTYELQPEGNKSRLTLTWEGTHTFPAETFTPEGFKLGANNLLDALEAFIKEEEA